jgi:hypothetical protein
MDQLGDLNNAGRAEEQPLPEMMPGEDAHSRAALPEPKAEGLLKRCGRSKRLTVMLALIAAVTGMYLVTGIVSGFTNISKEGYELFASLVVIIGMLASGHSATEAASREPKA